MPSPQTCQTGCPRSSITISTVGPSVMACWPVPEVAAGKLGDLLPAAMNLQGLTDVELLSLLKVLPSGETTRPGASDLEAMTARATRLEALYWVTGRNRAGSEMRGLYTGLGGGDPAPF